MMPMRRVLTIRLKGQLSETALEELRRRLGLQSEGRLTDREDVEFGYRYLRRDEGNFVRLGLSREGDGNADWVIHLTCQNEPPDEGTMRRLRSEVAGAAGGLGLAFEE
jgi:hypothetical protein